MSKSSYKQSKSSRAIDQLSPRDPSGAAVDARRLLKPIRQDVIDLLGQLVRTDTIAVPPEGNETAGQKVLARFCKAVGLDVEMYDVGFIKRSRHRLVRRGRNYAGRCNLISRISGTGQGKSLLLTGHMDTVGIGQGKWRHEPLSGEVAGGKLYGRGSVDMKGGLAAHFAVAAALSKAGIRLGGDLLCESVIDEESAGGGGTLAGRARGDNADACVITEGTDLAVFRASRGGYFFDLTAQAGDPSAYFSTSKVTSPTAAMGRLIGWVDQWAGMRRTLAAKGAYKAFPNPTPVQILAIEAGSLAPDAPWATPLTARLRVFFQFLPHENISAIISKVKRSLASFCKSDPFFRRYPPSWRDVVDPPLLGHELPARHEWTKCLTRCAEAVLRRPVTVTAAPYPCDAFICQREFNIPTLIFGPCGAGAHNVNEYVTTRSVLQTAEVLLATALHWCGSQ